MKLFLTSYAVHSIPKIIPLLSKKPEETRVAFIPTASDIYKYRPWIDHDKYALVRAGFHVFDVGLQAPLDAEGFPIEDKQKTKAELLNELSDADMIFVAGGNTFYLLEQAQKSGFIEIAQELVQNDKMYMGSSAGSILAGPDIAPAEFFDDRAEANVSDTRGFGWVDFVMQPHFDPKNPDPEYAAAKKKYEKDFKFVTLDDSQVVVGSGGEDWKII